MYRQGGSDRATRSTAAGWETITWDASSFKLPLPVNPDEPPYKKQTYYTQTIHAIDVSSASPTTKSNVLQSRFPYPNHITEAENRLRHLLVRATEHATTLDLSHESFRFQDLQLKNLNGDPLNLAANAQALPNAIRAQARYLAFQLSTQVGVAYQGEAADKDNAQFSDASFHVAIQLPIDNDGRVHEQITPAILATPQQLWTTIKEIRGGQEPIIGTYKVTRDNPMALHVDTFRTKYERHVAEQVYRLHKVILKSDYLGKYVSEPSQFQTALANVKQVHFDVLTGKTAIRTVENYHIEFTQVLQTWDRNTPLPMDAVQTFWAGLHEDIKEQARSHDYHPPAVPVGPPESYQGMLTRLRKAKAKAEAFARELKTTAKFVNKAIGRTGQRRQPAQAFYTDPQEDAPANQFVFQPLAYTAPVMAAPHAARTVHELEAGPYEETPLDDTDPYGQYDPYHGPSAYAVRPYASRPYEDEPPPEPLRGLRRMMESFADRANVFFTSATRPEDCKMFAEEATAMAVACASLAEDALRKATNSARPPLECWGCSQHPDANVRADRFHRYFDCKRKLSDSKVRELGEAKLKEYIAERDARRRQRRNQQYGPASTYTVTSNDEAVAAGHYSADTANLVVTIASAETTPSVRSACYQSLREKLQVPPTVPTNVATGKRKADDKDDGTGATFQPKPWKSSDAGGVHFHFMPAMEETQVAHVMNAIAQRHKVHLEITQVLPHVRLPIGKVGNSSVFAMIDSGAGLSLGRLQYHKSIYEKYPDLVEHFVYLKDADNMDEFGLGQIGEGDGPKVTAVISYHTPWVINGQRVTASFGLSDSVTANTIIGLPFLKAADAITMFGSNALILQRVGTTLSIDYQVPLRANQAPQTTPECQAFAYGVDQETYRHIQCLKSTLAISATAASNPGLDAFTPRSNQE